MSEQDNPFADDDDVDKTVVQSGPARPAPEAQAAARPRPPTGTAPRASGGAPSRSDPDPVSGPAVSRSGVRWDKADPSAFTGGSISRLVDAAAPLLALVTWCRDLEHHSDPDGVLDRAIAEIRAFENAALASGYTPEQIRTARYSLCATLDDVVLATPWGGQSAWSHRGLVSTIHKETLSGERFFDLLDYLLNRAEEHIEELQLFYICLSLGFEGKYRIQPRGSNDLNRVRDKLYRVIRHYGGDGEPDLSPSSHGSGEQHRPLGAVIPLWAPVATVGVLLVGIGAVFWTDRMGETAAVASSLASLGDPDTPLTVARPDPPEPIVMPEVPEVVEYSPPDQDGTTVLARVSTFLQAEIDDGLVQVTEEADGIMVRVLEPDQFELASTTPTEELRRLMGRIAGAMDVEAGEITVIGHTDSLPIRSGPYPDNQALSEARAEAGAEALAAGLDEPGRVSHEGQGDAQPVASNDTSEGRARNRRLEVILEPSPPEEAL